MDLINELTIKTHLFGQMASAINRETGQPWNDWRVKHMHKPGLILVCTSTAFDGEMVYLYTYNESGSYPWVHTSPGTITRDEAQLTITTPHSIYAYEIGACGLTDNQQDELLGGVLLRLTYRDALRRLQAAYMQPDSPLRRHSVPMGITDMWMDNDGQLHLAFDDGGEEII